MGIVSTSFSDAEILAALRRSSRIGIAGQIAGVAGLAAGIAALLLAIWG